MTVLRSALFQFLFYVWLLTVGLLATPLLLGSRRDSRRVVTTWAHGVVFLARWICGVRFVVTADGPLPQRPFIIASKHQSTWETCALVCQFKDAAYVIKAELLRLPIFGWYGNGGGHISVDREAGGKALRRMLQDAQRLKDEAANLIIFPEGTRVEPGEAPDLKPGIIGLYRAMNVPVLPVALDSGRCWPRGWRLHPGVIHVRYRPVIPPGLDKDTLMLQLHEAINADPASAAGA